MNDLSQSVMNVADAPGRTSMRLAWLSALYAAPPSVDVVASHRRGPAAGILEDLAREDAFAAGVARMREALAAGGDAVVAARLERAYGLLFEGIAGPRTTPPYELAFRPGASRRLYQAPTAEMEALLAERDMSVSVDAALPADHLAVELALAAHLMTAADPAFPAMARRLASWVPEFCAECAEADGTGFWAGAASVLAALVSQQAQVPETTQEEART